MEDSITRHCMFTLGYQGLSLREFVEKLEAHSIQVLVDVRRNAISRKAGFSKRSLSEKLAEIGIDYYHLPELGVPSENRKDLSVQDKGGYDSLFDFYERSIIPQATNALNVIRELANEKKRIALTCFESDYNYCHRARLSEILTRDKDVVDTVVHI